MTAASPRMLNALFPNAIAGAAAFALHLNDDRAAGWFVKRLPMASVPVGCPMAMTPWPLSEVFGGLGTVPDMPVLPGHSWLDDARAWAERSARMLLAASRSGEDIIHQSFGAPTGMHQVIDWLNVLPEMYPRMLDKLPRVTWDQAAEHARVYHERLKRGRLRVAGDEGTVDPIPTIAGHRWLHLVTPAALDAESAAMGHCVGDGGYDDETWDIGKDGLPQRPTHAIVATTGIWSLRDREGRSVLTAQVWCSGRVRQIQRRFNEASLPEDVPHVTILLDRLREVIPDLLDPDWIVRDERDGSRHHRYSMPDGIHLKGGMFRLNPCIWKRLPTHMRIDGDVELWGSHPGILDLDMGLHVTGRLDVGMGVRLTGELVVAGDLDLRTADVKDVPEGARVTGKVIIERQGERDEGEAGSIYTIGYGQVVFRPIRGQLRIMDEADGWCDADIHLRRPTYRRRYEVVQRTQEAVTVTYNAAAIRRTKEPGVPRHLQGEPRYQQIEHRGGRRPLR